MISQKDAAGQWLRQYEEGLGFEPSNDNLNDWDLLVSSHSPQEVDVYHTEDGRLVAVADNNSKGVWAEYITEGGPETPKKRVAGPGRRPLPPDQRKQQRTVILAPVTIARLEKATALGDTLGQTIDRIVASWDQMAELAFPLPTDQDLAEYEEEVAVAAAKAEREDHEAQDRDRTAYTEEVF
jgi:hypothetical protein